ncbi:MAG: hypothetical protein EBR86_12615 [Planctomycetia bacterium]|nr:hypothetical protein [Planctomycetia bacterium]
MAQPDSTNTAGIQATPAVPGVVPAGVTAGAEPRSGGWRRWLLTAGLLLVAAVLLGANAIPWYFAEPSRVSALVARAAPGLHADVTFGKVRLGWLTAPVFEDVRVVPRDGSRPPLSIRRIEGSHGLAAMLLSGGDLGRYAVEGAEVEVVFDADRDSNIARLVVPPQPGATGTPSAATPQRAPVRLRLDIADALVRVSGPWADEAWTSEPIDLQAALEHAPGGTHSDVVIGPTRLLDDARLDPNVAQGVLAYIAPILADATRTGGRFSLEIEGARLPLGAAEAGTLSGVLSMHAVDLGPGPLVSDILAALPGRLETPPAVRIADDSRITFRLAERKVWHDGLEFGVPLPGPARRLDLVSRGSVAIDDGALDLKLSLPLPEQLPADRPLLAAMAGKTVSIGVGGALGAPRVNFDGSLRRFAGDVVGDLLGRVAGQGPLLSRPTPVAPVPSAAPGVPPPPRPGWIAPRVGGSAAVTPAESSEARTPQNGAATPEPARLPRPGDAEALALPAPRTPADGDARTVDTSAGKAGQTAAQRPGSTADRLDQLKDRLPPEVAGNPSTDRLIDLVGGVIDELSRRRAERAAAEQQSSAGATGPAAAPPRRGRLLRRLLPLAPPPASPDGAPGR